MAASYPDQTHPIYRALPIADALDRLDRKQVPSDMSPAAMAAETLLIDAGDAAGGLSTSGFRHDLMRHVQIGERDQDEAIFDEHASHGRRGFYDHSREPCLEAHNHGRDLAERWIADVTAALARQGMRFDGRAIVGAVRIAA